MRATVMAPLLVATLLLASGCSGEKALEQPSPAGSVADQCSQVMGLLPEALVGQSRTSWEANVASWGDPRISVRCGVPKPEELEPTSRCDMLNGVGWFAEDPGTAVRKAWRFTTIGRSGYIEVIVPEKYEPAADVLIELTEAVKQMPVVKPCR